VQQHVLTAISGDPLRGDALVLLGDGIAPNGAREAWRATLPSTCSNELDDDGDGLVDTADPGCANAADGSERNIAVGCDDGIDDDGDGYVDLADPGCTDADDASERSPSLVCDDGLDNDGDGLVDTADPGCPFPIASPENPACDDGVDNDGDGLVDFDDPVCQPSWPYWEAPPPTSAFQVPPVCGVGAELALVMPLIGRLRRRRST